jgi:predicted dienelactone hydrolase
MTHNFFNTGFRELYYPREQGRDLVALWYPTHAMEEKTFYWLWQGIVASDAPINPSRHPLLIISHGMGGNMYNQYYLAEFLAKKGYIIAAINHDDRAYSLMTLIDRPNQLSRVLDLILNDASIKEHIDHDKIGIIGHSIGGYTALAVSGATPDISKHPSRCIPLLGNAYWGVDMITRLVSKLYLDLQGIKTNFHDPRVKAIALLAPGLGHLFDKNSLTKVEIPVFIMEAEQDEAVDKAPLTRLRNNLPQPPSYFLLKGAGHYCFLPICDNEHIRKIAPIICYDPGIPRQELHITIKTEILDFFDKTLKDNARITDSRSFRYS